MFGKGCTWKLLLKQIKINFREFFQVLMHFSMGKKQVVLEILIMAYWCQICKHESVKCYFLIMIEFN